MATSSNLLAIIEDCMNRLNLDQQTFLQINRIFNINPDNQLQAHSKPIMEDKLKTKILDIFNTEGDNYKDYLKLPKFNFLKPNSLEKLYSLFNNIWTKYSEELKNQQRDELRQQLDSLIPKLKSFNQIENFHLELLKQFKLSKACPLNKIGAVKQPQKTASNQHINNNFAENNQFKRYRQQQSDLTDTRRINNNNFSFKNNKNFPKIEEQNFPMPKPIWNDNKFVNQVGNFPIPGMTGRQPNMFPQTDFRNGFMNDKMQFKPNQLYPSKAEVLQPSFTNNLADGIQSDMSIETYFTGAQNEFSQKLQTFRFIECVCEGKQKSNSEYMTCKICQFSFHYKCLMINSSTKQQTCPCCKIKQGSNIFIKVYQQPFAKRWYKSIRTEKLSFFLTQKEINQMKKLRESCKSTSIIEYQLRFQKILKKDTLQTDKNKQAEKNKTFNNLPLPVEFVQNIKPFNMIEVNVKFQQEDKGNVDDTLFLFAIFLVERFNQSAIVEEFFGKLNDSNSVGEEYLKRHLGQKESMAISMKDRSTNTAIRYPVRGNNCQHAQVFDYLSTLGVFKAYGESFKNIYCSECDNKCDNIVADRYLFQKLNQKVSQAQNQILKYHRDGRVQWVQQNQQNQQHQGSEQEEQENDNQQNNSEEDISESIS